MAPHVTHIKHVPSDQRLNKRLCPALKTLVNKIYSAVTETLFGNGRAHTIISPFSEEEKQFMRLTGNPS